MEQSGNKVFFSFLIAWGYVMDLWLFSHLFVEYLLFLPFCCCLLDLIEMY